MEIHSNFPHFNYHAHPLNELHSLICSALDRAGHCLIQDMPDTPDNRALLALSELLGKPLLEKHNLHQGAVCEVKVEPEGQYSAYANTPFYFPSHTDCSDFPSPPDTVLLLCASNQSQGGESLWIHLDEVLSHLSPQEQEMLCHQEFVFRFFPYPILSQSPQGMHIRYNRVMLEIHYGSLGQDRSEKRLFDRLDQICETHSQRFKLHEGDCWVVNNHKLLHGRTAIQNDGFRLLKRLRLDRHL